MLYVFKQLAGIYVKGAAVSCLAPPGAEGTDPASVFPGRFSPMLSKLAWEDSKYSLHSLDCLTKNLLRENCTHPEALDFERILGANADVLLAQDEKDKPRRT